MKKVTSIDGDYTCKKFKTALNRFMKKFPGHEEWREAFEWMYEQGVDFFSDNYMADGSRNENWCYALHLDVYDSGHYYLALIERA